MKKYFIPFLILLSACGSGNARNSSDSEGVMHIDNKTQFLEKVFNYEANPDRVVPVSDLPVIVDFHADWCGPCLQMAPILEQLAEEHRGRLRIYKVDVDSNQEIASDFGITMLPTILFIPTDGDPVVSYGALSREDFDAAITNHFFD